MKVDTHFQLAPLVPEVSEAEARHILDPYLPLLVDAIEQAWERWWKLPTRDVKAASARSRASLVYDFICEEIRARFEHVAGVSLYETRHRMLLLNIGGLLVIRFKKLDNLKRGSNVSTRFQTEFTLQMQLPDLPPEAARLVVGYQLDEVQTKITNILVTYRIGNEVRWSFSARNDGAAGVPVAVTLPFPATPATPIVRKARITAKKPGTAASVREQIREAEEAEKTATKNQKESSER